jgi:hypothetical protein
VTSTLPDALETIGRNVLVSRSGVILLTIQFAILAGYAVLLVAGLLVERRRSEIALLRSRGASSSHLTRMALLEAALLAVPAAMIAPFLAVGIVGLLGAIGPTAGLGLLGDAQVSIRTVVVSLVAGAVAAIVLTLPTLSVAASPAGTRAADSRQAAVSLPQRLGLDLALVAVAVVALWQLRLYGAPLTVNARGTLGLDPLLVAAPAIGLIAGAVLALRIVPRAAELLERLLVRGPWTRRVPGRPAARASSAPVQPGCPAVDPGHGDGHARSLACRDLAAIPARPGGVAGRRRRPGHGRRLPDTAVLGGRPPVPGDPRRLGSGARDRRSVLGWTGDPRRHARGARSGGDRVHRDAAGGWFAERGHRARPTPRSA